MASKAKLRSRITVADGADGMIQVEDRRFERREWPISFEVPVGQAENWFHYLLAECERRGWSSVGMSQLDPRENSGSQMLLAAGAERLSITWDRIRGGILKVRARPAATLDLAEAQELIHNINQQSSAGATEPIYRWGTLEYEGRAWRGELWLGERLRLGPPSAQYEQAVFGPRAVIIDAVLDCISQGHSLHAHRHLHEELSAFLSVVTGTRFHLPESRRTWTYEITPEGTACSVRNLGYIETADHRGMPLSGTFPPVPLEPRDETEEQQAVRAMSQTEQAIPEDIVALWVRYRALTVERQEQFLAASSKFQEVRLHWGQRGTASFTSMVVACEALKPADPRYSEHNVYQVIETLLGKPAAERLRTQLFDQKIHPNVHPQAIRNAHLHGGKLYDSEFAHGIVMPNFGDPTFDAASRELFKTTKAAIIEWLRRGGELEMPTRNRKRTWRRWVREHALKIVPLTMAVGLCLGWLLRMLLSA